MGSQIRRVSNTGLQHGDGSFRLWFHDSYDGNIFSVAGKIVHEVLVIGLVFPNSILGIVGETVGIVNELEGDAKEIFIIEGGDILRQNGVFSFRKVLHGSIQFRRVLKTERVKRHIRDTGVFRKDHNGFVVVFRPVTGLDIILNGIQMVALRKGMEDIV